MKRTASLLLALSFVFTLGMASARKPAMNETTGMKWLEMTPDQRLNTIQYTVKFLKRSKVRLGKTAEDYYEQVYTALRKDPELYNTNVSSVLLDQVAETEPTLKESIDTYRQGY